MKDVVIVSGVRTAVGTRGGSLKDIHQADLGAMVIKEAVRRAGLEGNQVDEVIVGNVGQVAESGFIARMCSLKAGLPLETTAFSVNRQCGSGLQAINSAVQEIQSGNAEIVVACGTENMNQLPYYVRKARYGYGFGHGQLEDGLLTILTWPLGPYPNGVTAENIAERYHISREEQDAFALNSQQKAEAAIKAGKFVDEILPVEVPAGKRETRIFAQDEHPRFGLTMEQLAKLKPAFREGGTVTAGNSSGINDGAGAVVLMTAEKANKLGLKPLLLIRSQAVAGVDPDVMGIGPAPATMKAVEKAGLTLADIDLFELNEAFASQSIAVMRILGLPEEKVNVNGGAIALGHPIGATGIILTVKLQKEMVRRQAKYGIVTMCIGGGQGIATVFENIA
ncbi:Acetyl-CoA acetyltransferase [Moorella thermoacetica]|uniref:Acetyl-CoA acetyltransferase n=1 Tax=Neomoorella thermoacetica TaxID=1525 RepID=A0AAC9MV03_NEOTH|nr:thiolase family protein [Moorella thermoacetica]AOQ23986.1 Acetyl-CoA acetyltransferase [Moorella thermoacetica]TYL14390.1 Acetyl-CoA acetyltransferase [Moorella thermoacetica]